MQIWLEWLTTLPATLTRSMLGELGAFTRRAVRGGQQAIGETGRLPAHCRRTANTL